jgi:hypothetical protein
MMQIETADVLLYMLRTEAAAAENEASLQAVQERQKALWKKLGNDFLL